MLRVAMAVYYAAGAVAALVIAKRVYRETHVPKEPPCKSCKFCSRFYDSPNKFMRKAHCSVDMSWLDGDFPDICKYYERRPQDADL